jgi:intracellular sulfur oxidation DsrE/DsrF family protein
MHWIKAAAIGGATLALIVGATLSGFAQSKPQSAMTAMTQAQKTKVHRVVVQVTQNDPAVMNMALNNVENLVNYFHDKGEKIEVEVVAYGAGLNMRRSDTSPVKDRLATLAGNKSITFSGCGNTLSKQSASENKQISLVPEAHIVSAGIARVVELQEEGWTYVRP